MNLEISPRARGYRGLWIAAFRSARARSSRRSISRSTSPPTKSHPALAVGCPFVLKPASRTPIGALIIGEVLAETTCPTGAFSILPCRRDGAELFTTDERLETAELHRLAGRRLGR